MNDPREIIYISIILTTFKNGNREVSTKIKLLLVVVLLISLKTFAQRKYPVISYLDIKVDSMGNLPQNPYVLILKRKNKQLSVIGTQHSNDTTSKMFTVIENIFNKLKPEITINEGGNLTKKYTSRNQAIKKSGELGLEKYIADSAGIKTINGDMPDKLEFDRLSKAYSKEEALVYFASERFIFPYAFGQYSGDLETQYNSVFISGYFLKEKIDLNAEERTFAYYKQAYKKYFNLAFSLDNINQRDFTPFLKRGHFNDISRTSKQLRDQYLLSVVNDQFKLHHKILLVFGGWHILAIEPALKKIINDY